MYQWTFPIDQVLAWRSILHEASDLILFNRMDKCRHGTGDSISRMATKLDIDVLQPTLPKVQARIHDVSSFKRLQKRSVHSFPPDFRLIHTKDTEYVCACHSAASIADQEFFFGNCSLVDRISGRNRILCMRILQEGDQAEHARGGRLRFSITRRSGWSLGSFQCVEGVNDGISCEVNTGQRYTYCPNGACIAGSRKFFASWIFGIVFALFVSVAMGIISLAMKISADHRRKKRERQYTA
mmetsp:Transcript_48814/g.153239  ORF Transcript_48814/g.153239 Transcript_48814/m.153239 type:complete len:240 (-) Transcript_48814:948-1667(-)